MCLKEITIIEPEYVKSLNDLKLSQVTHNGDFQLWFICCPLCGDVGVLKHHTIKYFQEELTITPSLLCFCGANYFVEKNQIRWC